MPLLLDAGPLIALFSRRDAGHAPVRDYLRDSRAQLLTTWPVVTEAWHLLVQSQRIAMMRWIKAGGVKVADFDDESSDRLIGLLEKYGDLPMDLADASLVLLAQKTGVHQIMTLDRRDFLAYRLPGNKRFELVLDV